MSDDPHPALVALQNQHLAAVIEWVAADTAYTEAAADLQRRQDRMAAAMRRQGISARQLQRFRQCGPSAHPTSRNALAHFAQHYRPAMAVAQNWDGQIAAAKDGRDQAQTALEHATANLLAALPLGLAAELTGLSPRRLSILARRAAARTHTP